MKLYGLEITKVDCFNPTTLSEKEFMCDHDWREVEDMCDTAVECRKCGVPGTVYENEDGTGELQYPCT